MTNAMYRRTLIAAAAAAIVAPQAQAVEVNDDLSIYGSLRQGIETVDPESSDVDSYSGLRDAYTRIGLTGSSEVADGLTGSFTYELGIDSTTGEISTLDFDKGGAYGNKQARVSKIGLSGDFGSVHAGKMWGVFYNAIAYPVDMYSSYYAGWSTYSLFRTSDTLAYSTPEMAGFQFDAGVSFQKGEEEGDVSYGKFGVEEGSGAGGDKRGGGNVYTLTGTWSGGPLTASLGYELRSSEDDGDPENGQPDNEAALMGAAVSADLGNLDLAAQFEQVTDGIEATSGDGGYYVDVDGDRADYYDGTAYLEEDATVYNLYAGYTAGDFKYKAKYGEAEGVTGTFYHLGVDYNASEAMKFFAEYYDDEGGGFSPVGYDDGNSEGGSAFTVGAHYSF
ncbi:porin [Thiohalospira sp.]|uniref:porin n=1 Tax=Thiohalospira sp. TaxID=3080549 RepID=UPI00398021AB